MAILHNPRTPQAEVDAMFCDRWSPRALLSQQIPEEQIQSLFEAVRWAPSCYNEQPWLLLYASGQKERENFLSVLAEKNQIWAKHAALLIFVAARRRFALNDKENRHAAFDCGAAWMALALEARKLGLYAHAMAGFDLNKAYTVTGVPEKDYDIIAAIAVGKLGDPSSLPEDMKKIEYPGERKPLKEISKKGRL